tara:strand:+ start:4308 stop:4925 length:618 start_codon:yes stop_codon:yes gene_type:complete
MIKLLSSLLINAIYTFKNVMKFLFSKHDFTIVDRYVEYSIDHTKEYETNEPLWECEHEQHEPDTTHYLAQVGMTEKITPPPDAVSKLIIRVKFWYNNKIYKFLTCNAEYPWPPKKMKTMGFHIPLSSAQLLDSGDKPVKDVLEKIRRYSGPYSDFYGEKMKISDMFYYDESFMATVYPKIKIKNCFGMMKTVDTATGFLTDLQLP